MFADTLIMTYFLNEMGVERTKSYAIQHEIITCIYFYNNNYGKKVRLIN